MICKTLRFVAHTHGAHLQVRPSFLIQPQVNQCRPFPFLQAADHASDAKKCKNICDVINISAFQGMGYKIFVIWHRANFVARKLKF